jgi:glycosyltransferase involved in cell wall biosynthesis
MYDNRKRSLHTGELQTVKIKVSTNFPAEPIIRQTPGRLGFWKNFEFFINEPSCDDCDAWVVLEGLARPECARVRRGVAVLFAMEPPDAKTYLPGFLSQFDWVVTSHVGLKHPKILTGFQGLPWHIGLDRGFRGAHGEDGFKCVLDYDALSDMAPLAKSKLISTICSDARSLPGHRLRHQFLERLVQHFGDQLHIFGRGVRPVADKFEALAPYQYHVVLENSFVRHYWTEKLADSFLAYCFPIYWGCPNIDAYFPPDSLLRIDIFEPTRALDSISTLLANGLTARQRAAMLQARQLVLNRFNTFELIRNVISHIEVSKERRIVIKPERSFRGVGGSPLGARNESSFLGLDNVTDLSVVICSHNPRIDYLTRVLAALKGQTLPKDRWELLVVDNASADSVADHFDISWHVNGRHVREGQLGLAHARLRGIAQARGGLLVFVDDDNVLAPDYLEQALKIGQEHPFLAAWGGTVHPEFETSPEDWTRPHWEKLAVRDIRKPTWSNDAALWRTQPCGAGMCVRTVVARIHQVELAKDPVRKSFGRKGESLLSGEDTDLVLMGERLGLGWGTFPQLVLDHLIPTHRLTEAYLLRLTEGLAASSTALYVRLGYCVVKRTYRRNLLSWIKTFALCGPRKARFHWAYLCGVQRGFRLAGEI